MSKKKSNILSEANEIVNNRSEEKARQYGPFEEGIYIKISRIHIQLI
jgi:hypothetical protein